MPKKIFHVEGIGDVAIYKHATARNIRLRVNSEGLIRVTVPKWAPYRSGVLFAQSKKGWILQQAPKQMLIAHDTFIGQRHRVVISYGNKDRKQRFRVANDEIQATLPLGTDASSTDVQNQLIRTAEKALKTEAQDYLPRRLDQLATSHNFSYRNVSIKKMKSRWGSCTSRKDISLNVFLMQLDETLIDYVLLHELLHTKIQAHGKRFWSELDNYVPELAEVRKQMRLVEPRLFPR